MAAKGALSQATAMLARPEGPRCRLENQHCAYVDADADLCPLRRHVALPHAGEDRRVEPRHGDFDERHVAEEARASGTRAGAPPARPEAA